jgi:uncharacterized protein RhaS with RHS repeats
MVIHRVVWREKPHWNLRQRQKEEAIVTGLRAAKWLSRDPLGERGGINLYGYVRNNPVVWFDPFGLCDDEKKEAPVWVVGAIKDSIEVAEVVMAEDPLAELPIVVTQLVGTELGIDLGQNLIQQGVNQVGIAAQQAQYNQNTANPLPPSDAATQAATDANGGIPDDSSNYK